MEYVSPLNIMSFSVFSKIQEPMQSSHTMFNVLGLINLGIGVSIVASLVVFLNTQLPFTVVPSGRTTLVNCSAVLIVSPLNSQFSKMIVPKSPLIVTSSSTDWEDRVCCFQTLLHPLRSGVPSFPELLCPLSPSARFPVWVSVWVKGRREPAIAPPAQPDCYQSASPHRLRERLRTSPLSSNSVLRTPSAALALQ